MLYDNDDKHSLYARLHYQTPGEMEVEDEDDLHDLLDIEFRFGGDITLHQQTYIEKLASDFLPDGAPP
jgi:hypothetical protein|tara:strand:+ start:88 stop:291 length:204 start_codon:yes stop_codon:yes gene_type:complete